MRRYHKAIVAGLGILLYALIWAGPPRAQATTYGPFICEPPNK
jgi:hypothetical protein